MNTIESIFEKHEEGFLANSIDNPQMADSIRVLKEELEGEFETLDSKVEELKDEVETLGHDKKEVKELEREIEHLTENEISVFLDRKGIVTDFNNVQALGSLLTTMLVKQGDLPSGSTYPNYRVQ